MQKVSFFQGLDDDFLNCGLLFSHFWWVSRSQGSVYRGITGSFLSLKTVVEDSQLEKSPESASRIIPVTKPAKI